MNPALDAIRKSKKVKCGNVPGAIAVYAAIMELIEETQHESHVIATHDAIADKCLLCRHTVLYRLQDLEAARVFRVSKVSGSRAHRIELLNRFTELLNHSTAK